MGRRATNRRRNAATGLRASRQLPLLVVDRAQRDVLQRLVVDLELGDWAARGFELDAAHPACQQARRHRVQTAFWLLDDLGWTSTDPRSMFPIAVRDVDWLVRSLRQWRDWQVQAIADARRDRRDGTPVAAAASELLGAAERLAAIGALLAQLEHDAADEAGRS